MSNKDSASVYKHAEQAYLEVNRASMAAYKASEAIKRAGIR
jgi:hypothetical protein